MDDIWKDRAEGILLGQAIGDALGLGTEFMSKDQVAASYPNGLHDYGQIIQDRHRSRWRPGEWTDDTEQMLCILQSIWALHRVDVCDIAVRLRQWAATNGRGMGRTVRDVLIQPDFLTDPQGAAERVWESGGRRMAANGGIMRSSVLGVWHWWDADAVHVQAADVCRITHADPRCVHSCQWLCGVLAALLRGETPAAAHARTMERLTGAHPELLALPAGLECEGLGFLHLDEPASVGYTFKTLGAGMWALLHAGSFEQGLSAVIHEGGDADTNAAVAGAVLGARFGRSSVPTSWKEGLVDRMGLEARIGEFLRLTAAPLAGS